MERETSEIIKKYLSRLYTVSAYAKKTGQSRQGIHLKTRLGQLPIVVISGKVFIVGK